MARFCRGQSGGIAAALALLFGLSSGLPARSADDATSSLLLYDRPVLTVDPGMHTSKLSAAAVDAMGRFAATVAYDKTVRIWSIEDGGLLQTIRLPTGPGNTGVAFAVAMSPDGEVVAAGGWTSDDSIYLFDRTTGAMSGRITGLPNTTQSLAFSPDGRYLGAGLGRGGLRIYDRTKDWAEVSRDEDYHDPIDGLAFAKDGRLATSSRDGKARLYDQAFHLLDVVEESRGGPAMDVAFSPDGTELALGYVDVPAVDLLDGHNLVLLRGPDLEGLNNGGLSAVAWSRDGQTLFAGGKYWDDHGSPVIAWADAGRGKRRALPVANNTVIELASLPEGRLLIATGDPYVAVLEADGSPRWAHESPKADFRDQERSLAVSADGLVVDFAFQTDDTSPLRFSLQDLKLTDNWPADGRTTKPKQEGLNVENWFGSRMPTIDRNSLDLQPFEISRSMSIDPDNRRFVLGTNWHLAAMDAKGKRLWTREVSSDVWAVNITSDGRLVVAAYGDGTIRWHRMDDGRELLAFMVLGDRKNWVAWTPEGFYAATPGAHGVLQWLVNRGVDAAAVTVPVSQIPKLSRPDALALVLQELDTARALGIADMTAARVDVQRITGAARAPGARLHVLAIGVSDYGEKAKQLRLQFANKDAHDVASALLNTQESDLNRMGSIYAEVKLSVLEDKLADKPGIFDAFAAMQTNMAKSDTGNDVAVVMFSGHGAVIDDQLYLLPYGVDASTPARVKASAILASEFQAEVAKLAQHGRVLVLLDACHSGAVAADGSRLALNADLLRSLMAQNNVTVLTSSKADKLSREDKKWGNGAFTKVLLEGLGRGADTDHNGMISMSELTDYVATNLPILTDGDQTPGIEQRFQSDLFVAGL